MSIIVGLKKMIYFAKLVNLSRIHQGLAKNVNEKTKEAYWQLVIFTKMANWGIGQESIKGLSKPRMR